MKRTRARRIPTIVFGVPGFNTRWERLERFDPSKIGILGVSDDRNAAVALDMPDDFLRFYGASKRSYTVAQNVHLLPALILQAGDEAESVIGKRCAFAHVILEFSSSE